MTREEAIKHLETYSTTNGSGQTTQAQHEEAKQMAIKALEQEPCPNAISRSDMLDAIGHGKTYTSEELQKIIKALPPVTPQPCDDVISRQYLLDNCVVDKVTMPYVPVSKIENAPPATPQPKTGKWIEERTYMECPHCHDIWHYEENQTERFKCCPTCGERLK